MVILTDYRKVMLTVTPRGYRMDSPMDFRTETQTDLQTDFQTVTPKGCH